MSDHENELVIRVIGRLFYMALTITMSLVCGSELTNSMVPQRLGMEMERSLHLQPPFMALLRAFSSEQEASSMSSLPGWSKSLIFTGQLADLYLSRRW